MTAAPEYSPALMRAAQKIVDMGVEISFHPSPLVPSPEPDARRRYVAATLRKAGWVRLDLHGGDTWQPTTNLAQLQRSLGARVGEVYNPPMAIMDAATNAIVWEQEPAGPPAPPPPPEPEQLTFC